MSIASDLSAPCFLLGASQRGDRNFNRGVVFLLEHNEKGSMGLLLNRPSDVDMQTFLRSVELQTQAKGKGIVYRGGPVQVDRAFLLHVSEHKGPETEAVVGGLKLSYSLESLRMLVEDPPERMRVFLGYAGWGPGQLAQEFGTGAWLAAPADTRMLFETPAEALYDSVLRKLGIEPSQLAHRGAVN
jgi:putative transcriptional regulator